jgi:CubicO group peptidase (beta-lactamase class C family)
MEFFWTAIIIIGLVNAQPRQGFTLQVPFLAETTTFFNFPIGYSPTSNIRPYTSTPSSRNGTPLSVAIVRKDERSLTGWRHDFGAYGIAKGDGSPMTPDSVFAIASNSKLFPSFSVGLLVSNKTLAEQRKSDGRRKYTS